MKNKTLTVIGTAVLALAPFGSPNVASATCSAIPVGQFEPGVQFNFWCQQSWVNFYWSAHDFDQGDWDEGFGFEDPCNLSLPLGRTFNALEVLNYAAPVDATSTGDFSGNILHWGGNYAIREIDELDASCSTASRAYTAFGPIIDNYTELRIPAFYNENVVERAGTILHESRHADYCGHSGNDGTNPCLSRSESCDESFDDGCAGVGSPSGRGATGYQALWLWWFTVEADAVHGTTPMKDMARIEANRIFDTMFDVRPCFNITNTGQIVTTC